MADTIQIKRRTADNAAPTILADGELALNAFDMTLYAKNKDGVIKKLNESFPSGTRMLFQQTSAPSGWTKDTTHNDKALRVVSGTVSTGGSVAFTTAFSSKAVEGTVGSTTLSVAQMPSHGHNTTMNNSYGGNVESDSTFAWARADNGIPAGTTWTTQSTGGGGSHNHSFTGTAINMAVSYVDVIIATKD
jgi:hypothetical protein